VQGLYVAVIVEKLLNPCNPGIIPYAFENFLIMVSVSAADSML
jgi:hypothetical protein